MVVHNALRVATLFVYALIILIIVNETKGDIFEHCKPSEGFFFAPGTGLSQCMKILEGSVSWTDAKAACSNEGLWLAIPFNARALRQYIFERYRAWDFWVDAKGNSTEMIWMTDRGIGKDNVVKKNPLWMKGKSKSGSDTQCMILATNPEYIEQQPEKVYYSYECSKPSNILCEQKQISEPDGTNGMQTV